jgi:hypothetical protein
VLCEVVCEGNRDVLSQGQTPPKRSDPATLPPMWGGGHRYHDITVACE